MNQQSEPIRLAILSHRFQCNDGQGRVNFEVAKAALEAGYHVTIIATNCSHTLVSHPRCRFVKIGDDRLPTELLRNIYYASASARWLRAHRDEFDVVKANGFVTWEPCDVVAAHFVHAAWSKSEWYPFRSLHPYSLYQRLYTTLNTRWERSAFTRAKRVIAVGRPLVQQLLDIGVHAEKIELIWNGVDPTEFHPGVPDRAAFGLPATGVLALFAGDIRTPRKNLDTVLRALQQLPALSLVVAGAVERSPYPALARELGIEERVHFLGQVKSIDLLMRSVDMFVFPSRYEAHPLVLLEAIASGLPSIVSNTFGAEEFLGGAGFVLDDPGDVQTLTSYMKTLVESPSIRAQMGALGRRRALQMQWEATGREYLRVFENTLGRQCATELATAS